MEEKESPTRRTTVEYALETNSTTEKALQWTLGACGRVYNRLLAECKADAMEGIHQKSAYDLQGMLPGIKAEEPELYDVYSTCLKDVANRVHQAMSKCSWRKDGRPEHLPRFKSVHRYHSFTYRTDQGFWFEDGRLVLSKIGKFRFQNDYFPKDGVPKCCTVVRSARGRWYADITYEVPNIKKNEMLVENPFPEVGYDLGLRNIIAGSDGTIIPCPDFDNEVKDERKRLQKRMAECEKGSEGWEKARRKLAILHEDASRRRHGFCNHVAHDMVKGKFAISLEKLEPKRMKEKDGTPAAVRDMYKQASWGEIHRMVRCKAEGAGTVIRWVDPRNTSKMCSRCGHIKDSLPLSQRTYRCECCGLVMDRDVNAARNILHRGLGVESGPTANGRRHRTSAARILNLRVVAITQQHAGLKSPHSSIR